MWHFFQYVDENYLLIIIANKKRLLKSYLTYGIKAINLALFTSIATCLWCFAQVPVTLLGSILEYDKDHKLIHSAITVKKDYLARLQEENKKKVIYKS